MPELPEVETIRRGLAKIILGAKIFDIKILCEKSFVGPKELIINTPIREVSRLGKALLIHFQNNMTMMIHLRMTGQIIFREEQLADKNILGLVDAEENTRAFAGGHPNDAFFVELPNNQTRVIFSVDEIGRDGGLCNDIEDRGITNEKKLCGEKLCGEKSCGKKSGKIFFNDQRKFGFCKIIPTDELMQDSFIAKLAKEPWDMTVDEFREKLKRHKKSMIKPTILDQKVIAGVGNIYADEGLFFAKIHPERIIETLSDSEVSELLTGLATVMQKSIDAGGSTMATYVRADGSKGDYLQKFAQVFKREGQPCLRCGAEIIKTKVAGRGTHICLNCQRNRGEGRGIDG